MIEISVIFKREAMVFSGLPRGMVGQCEATCSLPVGTPSEINPKRITIIGNAKEGELTPGLSYRFFGNFRNHPRHGWQFSFQTFVKTSPLGKSGVIRYLEEAPYIGPQIAKQLWNLYGDEAIRQIRENPEQCAEKIERLHLASAMEASAFLKHESDLEGCRVDLLELFSSHRRIHAKIIHQLIDMFGNRAAEMIRLNAYLLLRCTGVGWRTAHSIYTGLGGDPRRTKCLVRCLEYFLMNKNQNTWMSKGEAEEVLNDFCESPHLEKCLAVGVRAGIFRTEERLVALEANAQQEDMVAERVTSGFAEGPWGITLSKTLTNHQKRQAEIALSSGIGVLLGSPGTGKTYVLAMIVEALLKLHARVAICSFTGKAAARINELLAEHGISRIEATTIHRLLGVVYVENDDAWTFKHNVSRRLPYEYVICDEASMNGTQIMSDLFAAMPQNSRMLLVGDLHQLPPIPHGAPLRDIVQSGKAPVGKLTEIVRNSGMIVEACRQIRTGAMFTYNDKTNLAEGKNLRFVQAQGLKALSSIRTFYKTLETKGVDFFWDVQVITAVNERSGFSRHSMNLFLQQELNPIGKKSFNGTFREGDKVICRKNTPFFSCDRSTLQIIKGTESIVANGTLGKVLSIIGYMMLVEFPEGRCVKTSLGEGCVFQLAYAITCHSAQGSEWPYVITMVDDSWGAKHVMNREWWTTAISRAKKLQILIGSFNAAVLTCKESGWSLGDRMTRLTDRICDMSGRTRAC